MKVFISSVTYRLKDERNALPDLLRLLDHEPLRFEDFLAQDRSGRQACLAGVEAAEVYVLLLGPKYGDPFPDSGLSPTAEEFRRARQRGIPILVFNKVVDEADEPTQAAFEDEVGHYVNGRFWRSFTDPLTCNQAVGEALKQLQVDVGPVRRATPPGPVRVPWVADIHAADGRGAFSGGGYGYGARGGGLVPGSVYAPVLELHLIPVGSPARISLRQLKSLVGQMALDARSAGFVSEADQLVIGAADGFAWVLRSPGTPPGMSSGSWLRGRTVEQFRGLVADQAGAVGAFTSLVTDTMGALVNQASLQSELAALFGLLFPHLPDLSDDAPVSVAAGLLNADRVWEGDPADLGNRTSGTMRSNQGATIRVAGDFVVPAGRLAGWFGDLGADLAHDIIADLNQLR